ncbi:MAG: hypothetical protein LBN43_08290 [Oscillospiraceae bacterium]|jgi:hypothetical protein|nr:hypothetical protein [Oscillospiraceae bacterium]
MKPKIITALLSFVTFLGAFTVTFSLPTKPKDNYAVPYENAAAFSEIVTPPPEIFVVKAEGDSILVYDSEGNVVLTNSAPTDIPYEDYAALTDGVVLSGREEMLKFLEDFAE